VGNDLREGKINLPLIYTLSRLGKAERNNLSIYLEDYRRFIKLGMDNGGKLTANSTTVFCPS